MSPVPDVVVSRLPLYVRELAQFQSRKVAVISSRELGARLGVTPAQIRKDLNYFGRFGKQGRGYNVRYLLKELREVLGLDRRWNAAVVGTGRLGRAIISYPGFRPQGFKVVAAFDSNPEAVGLAVNGLVVQDVAKLEETVRARNVHIAILAIPAAEAQAVATRLARCGVKAVLNYAPLRIQVPPGVRVRDIDPVLELQSMTFYLKSVAPRPR